MGGSDLWIIDQPRHSGNQEYLKLTVIQSSTVRVRPTTEFRVSNSLQNRFIQSYVDMNFINMEKTLHWI